MDRVPPTTNIYLEIEAKIDGIKTIEDVKEIRNSLYDMLLKVEEQIVALELETTGHDLIRYEHLKHEQENLMNYLNLLGDKSRPFLTSHQPGEEEPWLFDKTDKAWNDVNMQ